MPQTAGEHLQELVAAIESLPGSFRHPPILDARSENRALLILRRTLVAEADLAVTVLADRSPIDIEWVMYSFHLMDHANRCVFRYDNSPHYQGLSTFPHHKHEGHAEVVSPSEQPTIDAVVEEIRRHLEGRR